MSNITNKEDIKENQEPLKRAEYIWSLLNYALGSIESRKRWTYDYIRAFGGSFGSIGRKLSIYALLSDKERKRLKGTAVEKRGKDLLAIASLGDTKERAEVISALSDAEKPTASLRKAILRADIDYRGIRRNRAESMNFDWMCADPETLSEFLRLVAEWDPQLGGILYEAAQVAIKSWEES